MIKITKDEAYSSGLGLMLKIQVEILSESVRLYLPGIHSKEQEDLIIQNLIQILPILNAQNNRVENV